LLVNVTGCADVSLFEISEAMNLIHDSADPEANIIFGAVIDERLTGAIKITVIATNFATAEAARPESSRTALPLWAAAAASGKQGVADSEPQPDVTTPAFMRKSVN
jgi:cell division protein FtsZ